MKLFAIRIFVDDWDAACDFYRNKLGLPETFCDSNMGWAQFSVGEANLGIERVAPTDKEAQQLVGRFVGISLQVDDLQKAYTDLKERGVEFDGPPEKQPWGGSLANFRDPSGNTLTLILSPS